MSDTQQLSADERAREALAIGPVTWSSGAGNGHFSMAVDSLPIEIIEAQLASLAAANLSIMDTSELARLREERRLLLAFVHTWALDDLPIRADYGDDEGAFDAETRAEYRAARAAVAGIEPE